jgi:hypothetical protein
MYNESLVATGPWSSPLRNTPPQRLATFSELPTAKKPKPANHQHQPAGRTSPAAGVNEQNLTPIFDLALGRYGYGLGLGF